ncbi:FMN-binding negative transcriptional regulator [Nocardioides zhouii]|uniref:FMN-binding negative transcriptional regulator n=2 Tax=Nocardioides zhouii TaxID=1168729 RepID=A0A4Q2T5I7_9ACTN|nr:FMN-binding negative transcriptional regulator [Nocardioides zhouii]
MEPDAVRPFVEAVATAQLVTVGADGVPDATFLPVLWEGDRLVGHLARANAHWRRIVDGSPALAIVTGPDTYVSPSWYATKAEHGKVVPTWNYSVVHLRGRIVVHDDPEWVRALVTRLTDRHESSRDEPWAVTDAPADYIDKNLRPIVGVELLVESVEAKAKLSQNRSDEDRSGVARGLAADGVDPAGLVQE